MAEVDISIDVPLSKLHFPLAILQGEEPAY